MMHNDIHQALTYYLHTYFSERNLESTLQLFSEFCSGYGTGLDESYFNFEEMKTLYARDIQQAPDSIDFQIYNLKTELLLNNTGYSACQLNLQLHLAEQKLKLNHIRLSIFWTKKDQNWQVAHMHISFPADVHGKDEAYPVKELEERNTVLQRLVDERTKKLNEANIKLYKLLEEVKTLRGIIPICSYCKKIRDDNGAWEIIEAYISEHSDAQFSHGVCPECYKKIMEDME